MRSQLLHQMDAIELSMLQTVAAFSGSQARSGRQRAGARGRTSSAAAGRGSGGWREIIASGACRTQTPESQARPGDGEAHRQMRELQPAEASAPLGRGWRRRTACGSRAPGGPLAGVVAALGCGPRCGTHASRQRAAAQQSRFKVVSSAGPSRRRSPGAWCG
jgi:hypothetical protein